MKKALVVSACLMILCAAVCEGKAFTYSDLINRLTDLEQLAVLPEEGEKCQQAASWDRASMYDAATGEYVNWGANSDGTGIIRREGDAEVFAEIEGPAVIWRIWSAAPTAKHVKIYLDGADEPAVDLPFAAYFDGKHAPFTREALVHKTASGLNNYTPIPFQKSCKIVAEKGWGHYYHFTYTTYPKDTKLPTFSMKLTGAESKALDRANAILTNGGSDPAGKRDEEKTIVQDILLEPSESQSILNWDVPAALTAIKVKMDIPDGDEAYDLLRDITLSISWDAEKNPSVWAPLGDFFGTAPGENHYRSLPLGMTDDGFYGYWYMPFKSADIYLRNDSEKPVKLRFEVTVAPLSRPIEQLGRFHVKWHRDSDLDPGRRPDWTMLKTKGRGRFCGVMLHLWHPRGGWWGEGDEKFFIDGEKFPSTFGTGSEDYFGYAWGNPALFENCYHNQTISMNNKGHISVNRWHIGDNVPFMNSFEGSIEKYYPNNRPNLYACTSYWYLDRKGVDHYKPVPVGERTGYWWPISVYRVKGAIEGEKLRILHKTGGNTTTQALSGKSSSNEAQLWWTGGKPQDVLELALPVEESGTFAVKVQLTKAVDYGIVEMYLDGKKMRGSPFDLFNNGVVATGELDAGVFTLTKGEHKLRIEIVGANDKAKGYLFGLDYVKLDRVTVSD